jgi:hypothetical protein
MTKDFSFSKNADLANIMEVTKEPEQPKMIRQIKIEPKTKSPSFTLPKTPYNNFSQKAPLVPK